MSVPPSERRLRYLMDQTLIRWCGTVTVIFSFFAGAAIGSGVICFLMRREQKKTWLKGRSVCDSCGHQLAWYDLVPILSYVLCNGSCRYCGANIPITCVSGELIYGLLGVVCAVTFMSRATPVMIRLTFLLVAVIATVVYTSISKSIIKERATKNHD